MPPKTRPNTSPIGLARLGKTKPQGGPADYLARGDSPSLGLRRVARRMGQNGKTLWLGTIGWLRRRIAAARGGRRLSRHFTQELGWAIDRLRQLTESTEGDFLRLGEQVQEFFIAAQSMTDQGTQVVELVSGQAVQEATRHLESLVDDTKQRFKKSQAGFEQSLKILAAVRKEADLACRPLAGFQQMVMGLRVLGISTRMESARLQGQDEGFQFLAEEVSRLSDTIKEQTEGMASQLGSLTTRLDETLGSMGGLGDSLKNDVGNLVAVVGKSLGELRDRRGHSELIAARMAANAREVHANIAEVVSSMQFHDITRQRLEHVREALSTLIDGKPGATPAEVCGLQGALLNHAIEELGQAAQTMQTSLRGIAGSVRQVAQEARLLMQGEDPQALSFPERLEADLSRITDIASQMEQALSRLWNLVESVVGTLEQVGSSLRSIDSISYSIKFVALNAAIKSARLGGQGAALESLAQAIQHLSAEAQTTTKALGGVLDNMGQSARSLRRAMESDAGPGDQTTQILGGVLGSIRSGSAACDKLLGELEHHGRDLARRLEDGAAGIEFHLSIQAGVSEVMGCFEAFLGNRAEYRHGPIAASGGTAVLAQRYTMASERQVHQAWSMVTGGSSMPGPVPVEEHKAAPAEQHAGSAPQEHLELGDNVELF